MLKATYSAPVLFNLLEPRAIEGILCEVTTKLKSNAYCLLNIIICINSITDREP